MDGINNDFFNFIEVNRNISPSILRLKYHGKGLGFDVDLAIDQIEARKKFASKLPKCVAESRFIFPTLLSGEQSTNELIAEFHASLIVESTNSILDMTAGLGIDAMFMSGKCKAHTAIEQESLKAECLKHNKGIMGIENMTVVCSDSLAFLQDTPNKYDYIFIDPARRSDCNSRTYAFKDCSPDVVANHDLIQSKCGRLLIKASPMLDISKAVKDLKGVSEVWVISIKNECKELLIEQIFQTCLDDNPRINAVNFIADGRVDALSFNLSETKTAISTYINEPDIFSMKYLYEPNASIMKSLAWNVLGERWPGLKKASTDTHVFFSECLIENFPGRIVKIKEVISPKEAKKFKGKQYNIVTRNYIQNANELKRQLKINDGGAEFLYGLRIGDKGHPYLVECNSCLA